MSNPFSKLDDYYLDGLFGYFLDRFDCNPMEAALVEILNYSVQAEKSNSERRSIVKLPVASRRKETYVIFSKNIIRYHAWYDLLQERDKLDIFQLDLEKASQYFDYQAINTVGQKRAIALGWICRCALMKASSRDVSSRMPLVLLDEMVKNGLWSPIRGLGYVEQIIDEAQRSSSIVKLAPWLLKNGDDQEVVINRILEVIKGLPNAEYYKKTIAGVALAFHKIADRLYDIAEEVAKRENYSIDSVDAIVSLTPFLSSLSHRSIFESISTVEQPAMRARLLYALIPYLNESLLDRACEIAANTFGWWTDKKYQTMLSLAARMAEVGEIEDALLTAGRFPSSEWKMLALAKILPYVAAPTLRHDLIWQICFFADDLVEPEQPSLFTSVGGRRLRPEVLVHVLPFLSDTLFQAGLSDFIAQWDPQDNAWLIPQLVDNLPLERRIEVFEQAIEALRQNRHRPQAPVHQANAFCAMAELLPPEVQEKALELARSVDDVTNRAQMLSTLMPFLPEHLIQRALESILQIDELYNARWDALSQVARFLSDDMRQAVFRKAINTSDTECRIRWLLDLAPHLPQDLQDSAWAEIKQAVYEVYNPAKQLAPIFSKLPVEIRREALERAERQALQLKDDREQVRALLRLAPYLPHDIPKKIIPELLERASSKGFFFKTYRQSDLERTLQEERELLLRPLLPKLASCGHITELRHIIDEFKVEDQTAAFASVIPFLPIESLPSFLRQGIAHAKICGAVKSWLIALSNQNHPLSEEVLVRLPPLVEELDSDADRSEVITALAPRISASTASKILPLAWEISANVHRALTLAVLLTHLDEHERDKARHELERLVISKLSTLESIRFSGYLLEPVKTEILTRFLTTLQGVQEEEEKAKLIREGASYLSTEIANQAYSMAKNILSKPLRISAMACLIARLSKEERPKAVQQVLIDMESSEPEVQWLIDIIPFLDPETCSLSVNQLFQIIILQDEQERLASIQKATLLPPETLLVGWQFAIRQSATGSRKDLYEMIGDLAPITYRIGGGDAIRAQYDAIQDVASWWP